MTVAATDLELREGRAGDLRTTFAISALAVHHTATRLGILDGAPPTGDQIESEWRAQREVIEFVAGQPNGDYWICEDGGRPVGYARVCRLGAVEQLTELMVLPSHHRRGIGRALLERCLPGEPDPGVTRLVAAAGATSDLTLYTDFGTLPVSGHWHMRARADDYAERRAAEAGAAEPPVHALEPARATAAWAALEPAALGHRRSELQGFFARTRTCLATVDAGSGDATALCWVGSGGDVGPAVAAEPRALVAVVVGALDRIARAGAADVLGVYCTTDCWPLLLRLRGLGFRVHWPGWVMSSVPLPGLDRYMPMRPPHLL